MRTVACKRIYAQRLTPWLYCLLASGLVLMVFSHRHVQAASATANFNVTATVLTSCTVSATDLVFGTYDGGSASDTTTTSTISVNCSLLTPYTISLNSGTYASGAVRRMGSGTSRLTYEIYRDAGMTGIFGTVAAVLGVSGIGAGVAVPATIYGKIPKNQNVTPGSYADQITVTVDY
ncbi:Spore coat protein U (SCPU) domain-containing protein [Rhodoferax sp. OV413]|uniref:Csu type fimbrial protein n=1 Tax=Rhodoferax sp. OV413 TaxID=1855285 RepID=UPI00088F90E9|nr:spore coat U domain-containing protein [Rhodoferax sp. OV413]SDP83494.1 Spore coat protein U (SCPU) domain-containing protein [Rhodoferax sp. OV413]